MPILPWGKRYENLKRAEEILAECSNALELGEKKFGKTGRDWVFRRNWDDDSTEMRRMIYLAALSCSGINVEAAHFPPRRRRDLEAHAKTRFEDLSLEEAVRQKVAHFFQTLGKVEMKGVHATVMAQIEKPLIEQCLKWAGGNQLKAARVLGINRNTLRKKVKELKIKYEDT